ncbi:MAG: ABC transporter ATP-binding protein/permease [Exilispira sp.]|nr:ABC transporter ATP-binding protein/permease [Exilispira sp.]
MNIIKKLIRLMWKENKVIFIMSIIFTIFSAIFTMMQAEIGQALFSAININDKLKNNLDKSTIITDKQNLGQNEIKNEKQNIFKILLKNFSKIRNLKEFLVFIFSQKSIPLILFSGFLFLLFYFLLKLFLYIQGNLQSFLAFKASVQIQKNMFEKLLALPSLFFKTKAKSGELISRIINDINSIRIALMNIFNTLFFIPILVIFSLTMLFIKNSLFTALLILSGAIGVFLINKIAKMVKIQVVQSSKRLANSASYINQTIYGIEAIKVFNNEEYEKKQFSSLLNHYVLSYKKLIRLSLLERPLTELFGILILLSILTVGAFLLWHGKLNIEQIVGFLLYLLVLTPNLQSITKILFQISNAEGAYERLEEILVMENESKEFGQEKLDNFKGNIKFENVYFTYSQKEEKEEAEHALFDINISIKAGEFIAIVGPSGAGKSTFISLIPALITPKSGTIFFDNVDYKRLSLDEIRKQISVVPQDVVLFPDTIFNNIRFGRLDANEDEVYHYSKIANADSFIMSLPEGYNTILGERGATVSGGQKQRIAIARALIKQPKVLIFDEATSSLDSESERAIQNAMENIKHQQTTLVIAHRLSTVLNADRIVVLNKGKIEEIGTHKQLLENNGLYTKLYNSQFKN